MSCDVSSSFNQKNRSFDNTQDNTQDNSCRNLNPQTNQPKTLQIMSITQKKRTNKLEKQYKSGFKINKSIVGWLQMTCWMKDFTIDGIMLSLGLLSTYHKCKKIQKCKIESLLICCLYMSSKYIGRPQLSLRQIYDMTSKEFNQEQIVCFQAQILFMIQYNMNLSNLLIQQLQIKNYLKEEQRQKLCFITQILLLEDLSVIQNQEKFQQITDFVLKKSNKLKPSIQKILKTKQAKDLIQKYKSFFQVDLYLNQINFSSNSQ